MCKLIGQKCHICATRLPQNAAAPPPKTLRTAPAYPSPATRGRSTPSPCATAPPHPQSESGRAPRRGTRRAGLQDRHPSAARRASAPPCACRTRWLPWAPTLRAFRRPASPRPSYILQPMTCHACGAPLSSTARFCHKCGAAIATAGGTATGWRAGLPWALAGVALGALVAVVAMRSSAAPQRSDQPVAPFASSGGGRPPDISQMSPDERANRLFNRVMMLAEAGKTDSVQFFLPMALGAYAQLPQLDADARYHVGLLQLLGGDLQGALAQADTIQRAEPTHLFIYVLRARAYEQQRNAAQARHAFADYLRNEAAELARKRPEYAADAHGNELAAFHSEAVRQTGSGRTS